MHRLALDARTDLYSLGITLYYSLTGRRRSSDIGRGPCTTARPAAHSGTRCGGSDTILVLWVLELGLWAYRVEQAVAPKVLVDAT